jgi:RIO kinase 1
VRPIYCRVNDRAYPRLKDAVVEDDVYPMLYNQLLRDMRIMYHDCRLIHADLSEFNLLYASLTTQPDFSYNDKKLFIIDVSQSVEHDHPRSLEFLRMDIKNVTDFFRKKGVCTMHERTAFDFITAEAESVGRDEMVAKIHALVEEDQKNPEDVEVDERVFRQAYIPKSLFEVVDPERDTGIIQQGGKDDLIYSKFLNVQETKPEVKPAVELDHPPVENGQNEDAGESSGEEGSDDESDGSEDSSDEGPGKPRGHKHEDKEVKKV